MFDVQKRYLNLHEYQSKKLMDSFGVATQKWVLAHSPQEGVREARKNLRASELVVKAQILAGGRGKGKFNTGFHGGVHLCNTAEEAGSLVEQMVGNRLVTKQTSAEGVEVRSVMIAESINIKRELYVSILMDRAYGGPVIVYSPMGGMDIEEVAHKHPEAIFKEAVDIEKGPNTEQLKKIAKQLQFTPDKIDEAAHQLARLYEMFINLDCTQVEVNPFAETDEGKIICCDAKMNFDDNAAFRQKDIFNLHDSSEDDPREVQAQLFSLNYIGMEGNIGCMVNGAGLAMATMDIIKLYHGEPANFLDVGGGATEKQVTEAFKILTSDKRVKAILVNIFGGIMRCDIIASGVVAAARKIKIGIPVVVRLAGTNEALGKKILNESGLNFITADDLDDAAQKAVATLSKK
uniref:Succinate--CoA ligase [GDP-forming] subunit beta, mitochondrial n=1 Tax=Arcella intermedia TaxID=1963864 RepID=A0A6B2L5E8_9EUKA|eukprot:TRINITY_DN2577_c0_g1_i1.p1 TRINITY_DN2577_c0_g1~~TRINITY_DN2577_c0_g1_i1.p1  ORF type:complete len:448 (-),score=95.65 TRINITY_DN2577_c0_g1_i1:1200-2414(-)